MEPYQNDAASKNEPNGTQIAESIDTEKYLRKCGGAKVRAIRYAGNRIVMAVAMPQRDEEDVRFDLISLTTQKAARGVSVAVGPQTATGQGVEVEVTLTFDHITDWDFDAYWLVRTYRGIRIKAAFARGFSDRSGALSEIIHMKHGSEFDVCIRPNEKNQPEIQVAERIYPYMISVVMAVYNTKRFLSEAIKSVLAQKLSGLTKFVVGGKSKRCRERVYGDFYELILVDDGSTDGSGKICDKFAARYKQVKVIHKPNGGVSSARNEGIRAATGKYLNFMDSDDKFSDNVMESCFKSFEGWCDRTDVITFPSRFFGAAEGDHWLNDKFSRGSRIIDLWRESDSSLVFVNASMFKAETVKGKFWFDESLKTAEDIKFIYTLLLNGNAQIGVVSECTYWYRRRNAGEFSAIQESKQNINFYTTVLSGMMKWLIMTSREKYGFVPGYLQAMLAQQLQWRYCQDEKAEVACSVLDEAQFVQYKRNLAEIWNCIDDAVILRQKKIFQEHKAYILSEQKGEPFRQIASGGDMLYFCGDNLVSKASSFQVKLEFLTIADRQLCLEGYAMSLNRNAALYLCVNGNDFLPLRPLERDKNVYTLGDTILFATAFRCSIPLDSSVSQYSVAFYEKIDGQYIKKNDIRYHKTMPLSKAFSNSYYRKDGWFVRMKKCELKVQNVACIDPDEGTALNRYEKAFLVQVEQKLQGQEAKLAAADEGPEKDRLAKNTAALRDALALRREMLPVLEERRRTPHKKLWLLSDRSTAAGDNGEALFLYLTEHHASEVDAWFTVNDDSPDYERLRQVGHVVARNSREYLKLHLMADCIISSQGDEYIFNPFHPDRMTDVFRDLLADRPFVFLQHGIIKDDISDWLNRYNKNIRGFITSAAPEYQSILQYKYYYTEREVWLTGLPRHDRLYRDEKNYITIMPTWRRNLTKEEKENRGEFHLRDSFTDSLFFRFYNGLLNDKRLLAAAETYGYTVCFKLHPAFMDGLDRFDHDSRVKFMERELPYREIFAESNLVITDYSSTVMDFAYLRKPVAYCQFDREEFYDGQVYTEGYFDYERDGFGEVTYDLDALVDVIIDYMKNGCRLKPMYRERMDRFFAFNDHNNCERVYQKLKEL
ncbi:MAG: CDP-glycerol glycerophosphotransferase family protein [Clostridiales bacterium]|nr:CDP-glycerol glycerophosphotransferase family protein [Clostridiales bacterium]